MFGSASAWRSVSVLGTATLSACVALQVQRLEGAVRMEEGAKGS